MLSVVSCATIRDRLAPSAARTPSSLVRRSRAPAAGSRRSRRRSGARPRQRRPAGSASVACRPRAARWSGTTIAALALIRDRERLLEPRRDGGHLALRLLHANAGLEPGDHADSCARRARRGVRAAPRAGYATLVGGPRRKPESGRLSRRQSVNGALAEELTVAPIAGSGRPPRRRVQNSWPSTTVRRRVARQIRGAPRTRRPASASAAGTTSKLPGGHLARPRDSAGDARRR